MVRRHGDLLWGSKPPPAEARLVVQVSRWDRLKDMVGVLSAFADDVVPATPDVHLMLAGPDVSGVSDDPEGAEVLASCRAAWARLPESRRTRCHLARIPMDDVDENAIIINALQQHATVVVQKSLVEGFGLTVTEVRWRSRPVLASAVGDIQDQIIDGREGRCCRTLATCAVSRSVCNCCSRTLGWASGWDVAAMSGCGTNFSATDT